MALSWVLTLASVLLVSVPAARGMVDCELAGNCGEEPARRYVVAAVGDSLTDRRVGGGRYMTALAARCPSSRFDAYGVGGQRTNHMRWRFLRDVFGIGYRAKPKPGYTHVIVLGGINDLAAGPTRTVQLADTRRNLAYMYREARSRGATVVAVTVPPWGYVPGGWDRRPEATRRLNEWIVEQGRTGQVDHVVDVHPLMSCGDPDALCPEYRIWADDAIHWNEAGHGRVAEALHQAVFFDCR